MPTSPKPRQSSWIEPTPREVLLLRSGILQGEGALEAWYTWKAQESSKGLNSREVKLAPLVFCNLSESLPQDADLEVFGVEARKVWAWNQLVLRTLNEVSTSLTAGGVDPILLKGSALLPLFYKSTSSRRVADVDLLIEPQDFAKAAAILRRTGWAADEDGFFDHRFFHALTFYDENRRSIDLHYHALTTCCWPGADKDFIEGSLDVEIGGRKVRTLSPSDHLLHVCIHGQLWAELPPLRWYADSAAIIRNSDIDWDRLVLHSKNLDLNNVLARALEALENVSPRTIPPDIVAKLRADGPSTIEKAWLQTISFERRGHFWLSVVYQSAKFFSSVRSEPVLRKIQLVPEAIRYHSRQRNWRSVAGGILRRLRTVVLFRFHSKTQRQRITKPRI